MPKKDWLFHEQDFLFGNNASAYRHAFPSSGLTTGERFVREVIQNSVDAHDPTSSDPAVRVTFEKKVLLGADKAAFVKALNLDGELSARREFYKQDKDAPPKLGEFFDHIDDGKVPLPLMIVSDSNTIGLGGAWDKKERGDNFGRLVLGFGVGDKAGSDESTGGSFGFGKTVYTAAANSGLVAYYSVFKPTARTQDAHARFMATGVLAHHTKDKEYSGFAMLGEPLANGHASPFVNDEAHDFAKRCGLTVRSNDETGTTILVIGPEIEFDEIIAAAEVHWWPRILSHTLEVEVREGDRVEAPRPRSNASLEPFVRCWDALMSKPVNDKTKEKPLHAFEPAYKELAGKSPGRLMLTAVTPEELDAWENKEESDAAPSRDRVVLIRSTRMVISYHRASEHSGLPPFAGVFQADDDTTLNKVLTYSEPPPHNVWDWNSDRFKTYYPEIGPKAVRSVINRIRQHSRAFQEGLEPARPKNASASKSLGKILGRFLKSPGKKGVKPVSKFKRNVTISVSSVRSIEKGVEFDVSQIELALQPECTLSELECQLSVVTELLGDDRLAVLERREATLLDQNGKLLDSGPAPSANVVIKAGQPMSFKARAEVGGKDVTRVRVFVDEKVAAISEKAA